MDFSFRAVIRVIAGMDNIVQAAGRCNRNGESAEAGKVYVVNLNHDCENLSMLREIRQAQECTQSVLDAIAGKSTDISSAENIAAYYHRYYNDSVISGQFAYPVVIKSTETSLYTLLATNSFFVKAAPKNKKYRMRQAFKTAGQLYEVFDTQVTDVLVEYDAQSTEIVTGLCSEKAAHDMKYLQSLLEQAKPYMIRLYQYQIAMLSKAGMLYHDANGRVLILNRKCYSGETGFDMSSTDAELSCF